MAFFDLSLEELKKYNPERTEPKDFDTFWAESLKQTHAHALEPRFEPADFHLKTLETFDVTFNGYGGQAIKGWLLLPRERKGKLPCVVEYIGYGGGRALPSMWLLWACAGFAHLVMDTRGQGSVWAPGDTPDIQPDGSSAHVPGFMTLGVLDPKTYYYRRLFCDAVRAVEAAQLHPAVDAQRMAVTGKSQGGGVTLAVSGLLPDVVKVAMPDVPYLCHYRRATQLVDTNPYHEISKYCQTHRDKVEQVFSTLSYFDGLNFAARAKAQALFSVGLMDDICPPSTVFAAYNHYAAEKDIRVWEYNQHEGGEVYMEKEKVDFLNRLWG